ncbi:MAG: cytochrome o ubiquinol oxidase subunit IV [Gammaproteobacteria bacterium RIFCSPLOWO2_02_FULL_42_14]|nr:MAG: cytochrome o ubiquinol oxidase subunit IV [Gammaproteobacteria bacterium RIFCSPHIGHO2_02_FULL_42_43]OGT52016.1 MAG: cytochrome o ubiquinol oxidase subunit IV [Gammaproteobacteria bacterium RIFCSPHIGHO2_12_FULL_41_25]OGT61121.1 MAG: cytochrome o ubiquinol oxidase subunit IV [Gammaproteobacteria bacterium RIFCSPLOWO2_02_FULL_42_14]OGT87049.1 MAG: cytochrome o ubiquinol oxidase subunit IV [Gammaproteobacteria bacterium RIFCSPLOWO2_12_FULL_42_18]
MATQSTDTMKYGVKPKTLKSYVTGLLLSLIFTFVAFALVYEHHLSVDALFILVTVLALFQLFAQVICFLRLNMTSEGAWNSLAFIFTILVVLVVVFGSLWIMFNLNYNMMH